MRLFGKRKIVDERIENVRNRIHKEALYLVLAILAVSMIVKAYVYHVTAIVELVAFIAAGGYLVLRSVMLGIYADEVEVHDRSSKVTYGSKTVIIGLVSGLVIAVFFGVRSAVVFGDEATRLWYFVLTFFGALMIYCPFFVSIIAIPHLLAQRVSARDADDEN